MKFFLWKTRSHHRSVIVGKIIEICKFVSGFFCSSRSIETLSRFYFHICPVPSKSNRATRSTMEEIRHLRWIATFNFWLIKERLERSRCRNGFLIVGHDASKPINRPTLIEGVGWKIRCSSLGFCLDYCCIDRPRQRSFELVGQSGEVRFGFLT